MRFKRSNFKYSGSIRDEYFVDRPVYGVITDHLSREEEAGDGIMNSRTFNGFWRLCKVLGLNTNSLYKASVLPEVGYDGVERSRRWKEGVDSFHEVLADMADRGVKSVIVLGELAKDVLFPDDNESFAKLRGSYKTYMGMNVVCAYHPREINMKRFKSRGGQANLSITLSYDIRKWMLAGRDGFYIPEERFNINPTIDDVRTFITDGLVNNKIFAMDIETSGLRRDWGRVVMVGLATSDEDALCIPFWTTGWSLYWRPSEFHEVKQLIGDVLTHGRHMWQNALFDVPFLREKGFPTSLDRDHLVHDTMLLHHAISPELPHDIGFITSLYGKTGYWKDVFLSDSKPIIEQDQQEVRAYNLRDCVVLHQVLPGLLEDLHDNDQEAAYEENMRDIPGAVEQMETGVVLNVDRMAALRASLKKQISATEGHLRTLGHLPDVFNLNSSDHLAWFMYHQPLPQFEDLDAMGKDFRPQTQVLYTCPKGHKHWTWPDDPPPTGPCRWCKEDVTYTKTEETREKVRRNPVGKDGTPTAVYQKYLDMKSLRDDVNPIIYGKFYPSKSRDTQKIITDKQARAAAVGSLVNEMERIAAFKRPTAENAQRMKLLRKMKIWLHFFDRYQLLQKQLSTYTVYKPWNDGRLHSNILLHGTASGRPASRNPNLLNVSKKYKPVRQIFGCPSDKVIVSFDFSNIEAKMLAYITGDEKFIEAVDSGNLHDINTRTLFNLGPTDYMWGLGRRAAKIFQFGYISYGGKDKTIWLKVCIEVPGLTLSLKQFQEAGERYFGHYHKFGRWRTEVAKQAKADRVSISPFGRKRFLHGSDSDIIKQAYNHPPQSGAAHVMNTAMQQALIARDEAGMKSRLQIQIYDDLRFECPVEEVGSLVRLVTPIMQQPFVINGVERRFDTDLEIGVNWGDLTAVDKDYYLKGGEYKHD